MPMRPAAHLTPLGILRGLIAGLFVIAAGAGVTALGIVLFLM